MLGPGREFDLIRRFLRAQGEPSADVEVGSGDDCAVLDAGRIALSIDLAIEGIHFRREWLTPEEIGYRAAAAALSDLAAIAARPVGLLAALAATSADAEEIGPSIMRGVLHAAAEAGAAVIGGDLTRSPGPIVLDVAVAGSVERPALRSGARPGDAVWVTGRLGGAAAAVAAWRDGIEPEADARAAFARPAMRLEEARWLADRGIVHAMIDVSDGIAGDAAHLAAASGARIVLDASDIPLHAALAQLEPARALELALRGGEDYELLFAAPPGVTEAHALEFTRAFGVPLANVGSVVPGTGVTLRRAGGEEEPLAGGFDHFQQA